MLKKLFDKNTNRTITQGAPVYLAPPIVAVLGAKGGVGTTSIAVNLAAAIASTGVPTTILDANLQQPDVAHMVGTEPEHSLMELLNRGCQLDKQVFEACSVPLAGSHFNLNLLSPPLDGNIAISANLSQLAECLNSIRSYSSFWILDLPRHIDKHLVTLIDMCDKIILVFEATLAGVATCRRWLNIFGELGYDEEKIICVLNRAGSKYAGVEQQLSQCFTSETVFRVPNASSIAWQCSTRGIPIVLAEPNHKYSQTLIEIAQYLNQSFLER